MSGMYLAMPSCVFWVPVMFCAAGIIPCTWFSLRTAEVFPWKLLRGYMP